ncbi:Transcriptional regulator, LysR family protein [Minicystis rosea]|nr:Transcriptional regulator, LysR family protein [Minicystis rosea]
MDLNHLSTFAAVAETTSFTEAARTLGVPKSTVSRAVASLEASLGVRLLQRTTRHVALTTAGQALIDRLGPRLAALTEAVQGLPELEDEPSGVLKLSATSDFATEILAEIVAGFCRRYPRITVQMGLSTRLVDLAREGYDGAFRLLGQRVKDSTLIGRKVGDLNVQLFASPAYLAARGTPKVPDDLLTHDCVVISGTGRFSLEGVMQVRLPVRPRIIAEDGFFVREAVRHGAGIGILPTFIVQQDVLDGKLVRVLPRWEMPIGGIYLVYPSGRHLPKKMAVFRDHVIATLRARPVGAVTER